jgi:hypothetical protein
MSFGLKNAGATYQRAIQMCFADQLHRNVEVYVDDVVIKTRESGDLIADLEETFSNLRKFWWKLNPTKCIFGVPSGKLLGFIISNRGIEANPVKISAITDMEAPATIKDVQKLTGCMVALNRFISRLGQRGLPFFKLLKCQDKFQWLEEAERALQDLKHHLQSPPILTAPLPGEDHGNNSCCQLCYCCRARRGRPCIWSAEACLLHQRGTLRIQGMIPHRSKAFICNSNRIKKAAPLFRRVQDHCDYGFPAGGYSS